jgi:hypothetical protein
VVNGAHTTDENGQSVIVQNYDPRQSNDPNVDKVALSPSDTAQNVTNLGHENQHAIDAAQGVATTEDYAKLEGAKQTDYFSFALDNYNLGEMNTGSTEQDAAYFSANRNNPTTQAGNVFADGIDPGKTDYDVTVYSRYVNIPGNESATHLFAVVDGSNYGGETQIISLQGSNGGGSPTINTQVGYPNDSAALVNGTTVDSQVIAIPNGMTEQAFDNQVIQNANNFDVTAPENSYPNALTQFIHFGTSNPTSPYHTNRNSNTYIDNIIEQSGGSIKDFNGALFQNSGEKTYIPKTFVPGLLP